jgi:hypothetical protein
MDPDDHATTGAVVPEGSARRELTGDITWCTVIQRTLVSPKLANGGTIFWCDAVTAVIRMSRVCPILPFVAASTRARIFIEINGILFLCLNLCIRHLETATKLLNKILQPRQDVQSILGRTEKWLKRHRMRTLRKNSPGQVEWNGGSST